MESFLAYVGRCFWLQGKNLKEKSMTCRMVVSETGVVMSVTINNLCRIRMLLGSPKEDLVESGMSFADSLYIYANRTQYEDIMYRVYDTTDLGENEFLCLLNHMEEYGKIHFNRVASDNGDSLISVARNSRAELCPCFSQALPAPVPKNEMTSPEGKSVVDILK